MPGELGFDTGPFVNAAFFCNLVIDGKDGVSSYIRVVNRLTVNAEGPEAPDEMPETVVQATLVVILRAGRAQGSVRLRIDVERPDGSRLPGPEKAMSFPAGEAGGISITSMMHIQLVSAGLYWTDIYLNDHLMTRVPLEIVYEFTRPLGA